MNTFINIFLQLVWTVNVLVIIWFIVGLLFAFNVVGRGNQFLTAIHDSISRLFEPILRPIRRILPETGSIDFSPMVFLFLLWTIGEILRGLAS